MRVADQCDVVVIGAGPAGSTAAQLLASWGWSVVLAHHAARSPSLAESLPASTRKLLAFVGQLPRVERAGFHPNDGNVARWADESRVTQSPDSGFHVSRTEFDRVLRESAAATTARIVDAVVRRVDAGDPACVTYTAADGTPAIVHARCVLDCSGRAGVVARRGWRRTHARYGTLAIAAEWNCPAWPPDEHTRTLVESYADGWAWSVPLSATRRQCTVMIDRGRSRRAGSKGPGLQAIYERELAHAHALRARLERAAQVATPFVCDASIYDCTQAAGDNVLLVGDAASFIEPLSSAGVKKALLSAWRAAIVANTCLKDSSRAGAARDLYNRREHQVYADCQRRSAGFFAEAAGAHGSTFWSVRADAANADAAPRGADGDWTDEALAHDAGVREAFASLRASNRVRLQPAASLLVEPVAAIEGREVVLRDALVVPGIAAPMRFAAGVDLPALARLAAGRDVPALVDAYRTEVGPVPIAVLLTGLSLLVTRHAPVTEGSAS